MKDNFSNSLNNIWNNLMSGGVYGYCFRHPDFTFTDYGYTFTASLSYDSIKKLFFWRHAGQSANKATMQDLAWIITVIFNMTPPEFEKRFLLESVYNTFVRLHDTESMQKAFKDYIAA